MKKLFLTGFIALSSTLSFAAFDVASVVAAKNFKLVDAKSGNCPEAIIAEKIGSDLFLYDSESQVQLSMFTAEQINGKARADLDGKQMTITTKHKIVWRRKTDYSKEKSSIKFKHNELRVTEDSTAKTLFGVGAELQFDCVYKAE